MLSPSPAVNQTETHQPDTSPLLSHVARFSKLFIVTKIFHLLLLSSLSDFDSPHISDQILFTLFISSCKSYKLF